MSFPQMPFSFMRSRRFLRGDVAIGFSGLDVRADGEILKSLQGDVRIEFGSLDISADGTIIAANPSLGNWRSLSESEWRSMTQNNWSGNGTIIAWRSLSGSEWKSMTQNNWNGIS